MRFISNELPRHHIGEKNNAAAQGIRWISSVRRTRESIGRFGSGGVKSLIAGFISLGVNEPDHLKEEISDILGFAADETVAAQLAAALAEADELSLWKQCADGSLVLT